MSDGLIALLISEVSSNCVVCHALLPDRSARSSEVTVFLVFCGNILKDFHPRELFFLGEPLWNKIQSALDANHGISPQSPNLRTRTQTDSVGTEGGYLRKDYRRVKTESSLESLESIFKYSGKTRHEGTQQRL